VGALARERKFSSPDETQSKLPPLQVGRAQGKTCAVTLQPLFDFAQAGQIDQLFFVRSNFSARLFTEYGGTSRNAGGRRRCHAKQCQCKPKPGADAVFRRQTEEDRVQPQAVNLKESKKSLQSDTRLREEAKNQASGWGDLQSGKWQENAK
jgi:hypothetical protein